MLRPGFKRADRKPETFLNQFTICYTRLSKMLSPCQDLLQMVGLQYEK